MLYCSVNGKQLDQVSVKNRGFSYGDGIFTTAKITGGEIERLALHINRLINSCNKLSIEMPDVVNFTQQLKGVASAFDSAVLKVVISAGEGGRGYSRIGVNSPTIVISVSEFPLHYQQWQKAGINLGISEQQLGINPMLAGLKHLNRLEQVLIKKELDQRKEDDILVTNIAGIVTETSSSNIFWLIDDILHTPEISNSGVSGLMRESILDSNPNTIIGDFTLLDIQQAQSMFICNCLMGIVPVKTFNGKLLSMLDLATYQ